MGIRYLYVIAGEGADSALVDTIEYDDASVSPAVRDVMSALDVDEDTARDLVAKSNSGAELSSEETARALAEQIRTRSVPDRDADTYGDYEGELVVTEIKPILPGAVVTATPVGSQTSAESAQ